VHIQTSIRVVRAFRMEMKEKSNQHSKARNRFSRCSRRIQSPGVDVARYAGAYGEERWIALGWMKELLGVVVYVERYADVIRVISARKADRHEAKRYEQEIGN
jgi:hypothetical protein